MLVLSRLAGEFIDLLLPDGRAVAVQVIAFRKTEGGHPKVRIAIQAPDDVKIYRREVLHRIAADGGIVGGGEVDITESPKLD